MTEGTRVDEARVPAPRKAPHLGGFGIRLVVAGDHDHRRARGKGGRVGTAQRAMLVPQPAKVGWRDQQRAGATRPSAIGRDTGGERGGQYVEYLVLDVTLKK